MLLANVWDVNNPLYMILQKYLTRWKYTGPIRNDGLTLAIMLNLDGVEKKYTTCPITTTVYIATSNDDSEILLHGITPLWDEKV